jgi:hypothetical protein
MMNRWLKTCWRETLICLLLAAAVWGVFGQTVRFGFVNYDDAAYAEAGRFDRR